MFGFEDSLKTLKKELKDAGADIGIIRDWQKYYDKVRKQAPTLESQYQTAKVELKVVLAALRTLEQYIIVGSLDKVILDAQVKELKKYQGHFNHEFFICKEDTDFHSTYDSIIKLGEKGVSEKADILILQSEIENLIALIVEGLEKKWPDFRALAYFYIERTDKVIADVPHADKIDKVHRIYENEFLKPIRECMTGWMREERINQIMEVELWKY